MGKGGHVSQLAMALLSSKASQLKNPTSHKHTSSSGTNKGQRKKARIDGQMKKKKMNSRCVEDSNSDTTHSNNGDNEVVLQPTQRSCTPASSTGDTIEVPDSSDENDDENEDSEAKACELMEYLSPYLLKICQCA
jgi:hypothetical protein